MNRTFLRAARLLCALLMLVSLTLTGCNKAKDDGHAPESVQPSAVSIEKATPAHDHNQLSNMSLKYEERDHGAVAIVIKDCKGNVLIDKIVPNKTPLVEYPIESIVCLSWVTDKNSPEGYECLYINRLTCQVSGIIKGVQAHNNKRIVYTVVQDNTLNVVARDLFYTDGFCQVTPVSDAYLDGTRTAKSATKVMDGKKLKSVRVVYYQDETGKEGCVYADLTEKEKTETAKKTEK